MPLYRAAWNPAMLVTSQKWNTAETSGRLISPDPSRDGAPSAWTCTLYDHQHHIAEQTPALRAAIWLGFPDPAARDLQTSFSRSPTPDPT